MVGTLNFFPFIRKSTLFHFRNGKTSFALVRAIIGENAMMIRRYPILIMSTTQSTARGIRYAIAIIILINADIVRAVFVWGISTWRFESHRSEA